MAQSELALPSIPQDHFLHSEGTNTPEAQVMEEIPLTPMFFLERIEVNPEGGYLCYKFAAEIEFKKDVHIRTVTVAELDKVGKEEEAMGYLPETYQVGVCQHCNKAVVRFIPKPELKNRVDLLYPTKGWPEPKIIAQVNQAKRLLATFLNFLTFKEVAAVLSLLMFLPWKRKISLMQKWIQQVTRLIGPVLEPILLKDQYYLPFTIETRRFISSFLTNLGIDELWANTLGYQFSILMEFDSQYRYWTEDVLTETDGQRLNKEPYRETKRLLKVFERRLQPIDSPKYGHGEVGSTKIRDLVTRVGPMLLILCHPRIRRAFREALKQIDLTKLQMDEVDRHEFLRVEGYDYMGRSIDDRYEEYLALYNGNPPIPTRYRRKQKPVGPAD